MNNPVMFYNGAAPDAHWRIGWAAFSADYTRVLARSATPLVSPQIERRENDTDIAFAASAVEIGSNVHQYYSVAEQYCMRAIIDRA